MNVKVKKVHKNAVIPSYANSGDAGLDLICTGFTSTLTYDEYNTGLALEIPQGFMGLVFPRSSVSMTNQWLCNSIGLIDSGYRGEIKLRYYSFEGYEKYKIGDKIGQLVILPFPAIELEEVTELASSERGEGGFGSTGG